jgi:hypothetical protein
MSEYYIPKVLLACPTYEGKNYAIHEWMDSVKNLNYVDYDILIVDNTNDNGKNAQWIRETFDVEVIHHYNPKAKDLKYLMAECQEIIRKRVMTGGYDYLFSLESDVIPPNKNIIQTLINHDKWVVSAMYEIGPKGYSFLLLQHLKKITLDGVEQLAPAQMTHPMIANFIDGTVKKIHACGVGCCLIHKGIFDYIKFRIDDKIGVHADSIFYMDLSNKGISAYADTSLICKHLRGNWDEVSKVRSKEFGDKKNE